MLRKSPIGVWRPDKVTAGEVEPNQSLLVRLVCVCMLWCAVDLLWLWTEASLALKGSCCLVRRKPERTQAGRRKSNDWNVAKTRRKSQKRKKWGRFPEGERAKEKKKEKELRALQNQLKSGETPNKINSVPVSCLEVSVTAGEANEPQQQQLQDPQKPLWSLSVTLCDCGREHRDIHSKVKEKATVSYSRTLKHHGGKVQSEKVMSTLLFGTSTFQCCFCCLMLPG